MAIHYSSSATPAVKELTKSLKKFSKESQKISRESHRLAKIMITIAMLTFLFNIGVLTYERGWVMGIILVIVFVFLIPLMKKL